MTTESAQSLPFETEVQELLDLMIHSLYSHPEIFLRELVSNASDACDKLRFEALTQPELIDGTDELGIRLEVDQEARTLTISDNGIGMSRDELIANLGTIAGSGTRRLMSELKEAGADERPELIGQFGVGFYASFMVADEVVVASRRAGTDAGHRWTSKADGRYTIEEAADLERGTRITLHLKDTGDDGQDFTADFVLREMIKRYSDFVEYPIKMGDDTLNSMKPVWARPKSEVTTEEYADFYKHLAHDFRDPLETIHFKAEGSTEYTALLYVPAERPMDLFREQQPQSKLSLYVKRVLISSECKELLPSWLRFVRGVVEAADLPLNVSREILQSNPHMRAIKKRLTKKVLSSLSTILADDRERYIGFWTSFGSVIKEGICLGEDPVGAIADLCLFESSRGKERTTLAEAAERMPDDQVAIYTVTGPDRATLDASPHVAAYVKRGFEVLYLTDPIDEWMLDRLQEYKDKPLRSVHAVDDELLSESEKESVEAAAEEHATLLTKLSEHFGDKLAEVRFSGRLADAPAMLGTKDGALRPHMDRAFAESHGGAPGSERVLELNPTHPLVARLAELADSGGDDFADRADLLYGQALMAEGSPIPDPARFSKLIVDLLGKL
jgi:molecular chaperone HtpG